MKSFKKLLKEGNNINGYKIVKGLPGWGIQSVDGGAILVFKDKKIAQEAAADDQVDDYLNNKMSASASWGELNTNEVKKELKKFEIDAKFVKNVTKIDSSE